MRYYAFFDPFNLNSAVKMFPLSIKTGPDDALHLPRGCREISQEEFNAYQTLGVKVEEPFLRLELDTNDIVEKTLIYYYYYYSKWLHALMKNHEGTAHWLSPIDWPLEDIDENRVRTDMGKVDSNPFFRNTLKNVDKLGREIIRDGMYFPFTFQINMNTKDPQLIFGRHRLYSLINVPKDIIQDKTFLFTYIPLIMPAFAPYQENFIITYTEPIDCYCFSKDFDQIFVSKCYNSFYSWNYMVSFCDTLSANLHPFLHLIPPNPIFNNKEKFNSFLQKDFPLIEKYEHYNKGQML